LFHFYKRHANNVQQVETLAKVDVNCETVVSPKQVILFVAEY